MRNVLAEITVKDSIDPGKAIEDMCQKLGLQ